MDYFSIIHKYIPPDSPAYPIYITHCHMVTQKSLEIAKRVGLDKASRRFIEEAAMLHDIGIIKTNAPKLHCFGELHYVCHCPEGRKILETEGLPQHALIAERHIGAGLRKEDIITQNLPLPHRDMAPESVEEEIVAYADLFYSKNVKRLWQAKPVDKVRENTARYGEHQLATFNSWHERFAEPTRI